MCSSVTATKLAESKDTHVIHVLLKHHASTPDEMHQRKVFLDGEVQSKYLLRITKCHKFILPTIMMEMTQTIYSYRYFIYVHTAIEFRSFLGGGFLFYIQCGRHENNEISHIRAALASGERKVKLT